MATFSTLRFYVLGYSEEMQDHLVEPGEEETICGRHELAHHWGRKGRVGSPSKEVMNYQEYREQRDLSVADFHGGEKPDPICGLCWNSHQ